MILLEVVAVKVNVELPVEKVLEVATNNPPPIECDSLEEAVKVALPRR
jgi:hypothetical protein